MKKKITLEGYLKCIPYAGDGWTLLPENREPKSIWDGTRIDHILGELEGKKIKITIEVIGD